MIKFFKNEDILVTAFSIASPKVVNNIVTNLIAGNDSDDNYFPISLLNDECDYNVSGSCATSVIDQSYLAESQYSGVIPNFEIGKYITASAVFYPKESQFYNVKTNPTNSVGTYQGQVYNTIKNMYYNSYNNSYNIFGFDGYDISKAKLNLTNEFSLFSFAPSQAGDRIKPGSVRINNQSGDIIGYIVDDSNYNLFLSGSYFIDYFSFNSNSDLITQGCCGLSSVISPTPAYCST